MNPNLESHNIISLRLLSTLSLSEDIIVKIHQASPPRDDGYSAFVDSYVVNGVSHRAWSWIGVKDKKSGKSYLELNYELGRGGRLGKTTPRINKLLDILSSINDEIGFSCTVEFKFKRGSKVKPIVPLPFKLIDSPDMPFNEINIINLVKREGKREKYSVIMGLDGGVLMQTVSFDYSARIQETLVDKIIGESVSISNRLTWKGE